MHKLNRKIDDIRSPKLFMGTGLVLGICSLILNIIGFTTPYWLQLWPRVGDSTFRNLGLWQVCIAGFRNPKDLWGKISYGCWWIFAREYDRLRQDGILLPRNLNNYFFLLFQIKNLKFVLFIAWFQAVQTMSCFSFMANILAVIFLVITASTNFRTSVRFLTTSAILCFATGNLKIISVLR